MALVLIDNSLFRSESGKIFFFFFFSCLDYEAQSQIGVEMINKQTRSAELALNYVK